MVHVFDTEVFRWAYDHAVDAATFLADDTNKLSNFDVESGEFPWLPKTDNVIQKGAATLSLNGYTDRVGNDLISPLFITSRTSRQVKWMLDERFDTTEDSSPATVGVYDQDREEWAVYICVATWTTENSVNNRYRDVIVVFTEAEVLA